MPRFSIALTLAGLALALPAHAQEGAPKYTADQLTQILSTPATPSMSADQFKAILTPHVRTRSLTAGEGSSPGEPGSGVVPNLQVNFGLNSADLTRDSRATLDELAKAMASDDLKGMKFEIAGHTDAKGSDRYNEELSRKRAMAVVSYLERKPGVSGGQLEAKGYGEHDLWDKSNPNNPMNRRVEVKTMN